MHVYVCVCVLQYATYAYVCGLNETCDVVCCIVVVKVVGTVLSPSVVYSASLHFSLSCLGHVGEECIGFAKLMYIYMPTTYSVE